MLGKPHTQIAILDDDPVSVITPFLCQDIICERLVLLHTQPLSFKLSWLKAYLHQSGTVLETVNIKEQSLSTGLSKWKQKPLAINVTQGNIGLQAQLIEWGKQQGHIVFWLDNRTDQLRFIHPATPEAIDVPDKLSISDYLGILGIRTLSAQREITSLAPYLPVARNWANHATASQKALKHLNYLAIQTNATTLTSRPLNLVQQQHRELQTMIDDICSAGLARYREQKLFFTSNTARQFCCGYWLEHYCFDQLHQLKAQRSDIQDLATNVEIEMGSPHNPLRNELDVVALINNRLYIFECKTSNADAKESQRTLYRLDMLRDRLGERTQAFWVNCHPISDVLKKRARQADISLIEAEAIADFTTLVNRVAKRHQTPQQS